MDFLSIIIDRVNTTNVFNIVRGRLPSRETHLQTIVDDDLIEEYLQEVGRLSRIANSLSARQKRQSSVDLLGELKRLGETFFVQFFPEAIQTRFRNSQGAYLFLHVDQRLRNIPWELLH
ncbi:MAG: CHAT domain-containing protein, partial [Leptospiraceae bacterium]|nr:CHAT domain-containing protein [Leptospiraceae bacterium]